MRRWEFDGRDDRVGYRVGFRAGFRVRFAVHAFALLSLLSSLSAPGVMAVPNESTKTAARSDTVVLLHGLSRSARHLWILEKRLERRGFRVCNLDYQSFFFLFYFFF